MIERKLSEVKFPFWESEEKKHVYLCECGKYFRYDPSHGLPRKYCELCRKNGVNLAGSNKRLYTIWTGIKSRCDHPSSVSYKYYGGRGITYCADWVDFNNFCYWALHNGYKDGLTIERIDVNKNYCPENCTWIPRSEQPKNTRRSYKNREITIDGVTKNVIEWCEYYNVPLSRTVKRINRGWDAIDALRKPISYPEAYKHFVEWRAKHNP